MNIYILFVIQVFSKPISSALDCCFVTINEQDVDTFHLRAAIAIQEVLPYHSRHISYTDRNEEVEGLDLSVGL